MTKVTYRTADGTEHVVDLKNGYSLMEGAVRENLSGMEAECGGACACATCQVYVDAAWVDKLPPKGEGEEAMLEFALNVRENSRLSCQIRVGPELEGLVVSLPENQR